MNSIMAKKPENPIPKLTLAFFMLTSFTLTAKEITGSNLKNISNSEISELRSFNEIKGIVKDDAGEPLPGVNVLIKGTTEGTITDINGNFTLNTDSKSTLVFSFVGYLSKEVLVGDQSQIDVILLSDTKALDEVVVVGYGTMKRSSLTGSVSTIDTKKIETFPSVNVLDAMQGQAAGVYISPSRQPSEEPSI